MKRDVKAKIDEASNKAQNKNKLFNMIQTYPRKYIGENILRKENKVDHTSNETRTSNNKK